MVVVDLHGIEIKMFLRQVRLLKVELALQANPRHTIKAGKCDVLHGTRRSQTGVRHNQDIDTDCDVAAITEKRQEHPDARSFNCPCIK